MHMTARRSGLLAILEGPIRTTTSSRRRRRAGRRRRLGGWRPSEPAEGFKPRGARMVSTFRHLASRQATP